MALRERLQKKVNAIRLVDHHAHNVWKDEVKNKTEFFLAFTETMEKEDARYCLAVRRSVREVAAILGCEPNLEVVNAKYWKLSSREIAQLSFRDSGIEKLYLDDLLSCSNDLESIEWHSEFVPNVRRILRIEVVAQQILDRVIIQNQVDNYEIDQFESEFLSQIDPPPNNVVAFKSIAAYRCGLNLSTSVDRTQVNLSLKEILKTSKHPIRLVDKSLVNFIFLLTLQVGSQRNIPLQIHTGFGDKDLDIFLANPVHLRPFFEQFQNAPIVLLHTYPYFREAAYLATVYKQVYVDFGLAIPQLSVEGMRRVLSGLLEICPTNKILFSTDGHQNALSFALGVKWARVILTDVLCSAIENGDLVEEEGEEVAISILRGTAERIYEHVDYSVASTKHDSTLPTTHEQEIIVTDFLTTWKRNFHQNLGQIQEQCKKHNIKFLRLTWCDNGNQTRCRVVPVRKFLESIAETGCCLHNSSSQFPCHMEIIIPGSGAKITGSIDLVADLTTFAITPHANNHATLFCTQFLDGLPWDRCPRFFLQRMIEKARKEFGVNFLCGFETEFCLFTWDEEEKIVPVESSPYSSSAGYDSRCELLDRIVDALEQQDIRVDMIHKESGQGQFEIVTGPFEPLQCADRLVLLRETIISQAKKDGLCASVLPVIDEKGLANGCHVHISLWKQGKNVFTGSEKDEYGISEIGKQFMAGVLHHLPSLVALTLPTKNSFRRLRPHHWAGAFQCWGTENKEAALRPSICSVGMSGKKKVITNVELKSVDGTSNPYLALGGIISAGLDGIRNHMILPAPTEDDPGTVNPGNTIPRLPATLSAALNLLEQNQVLKTDLGQNLLQCFLALKRFELKHFDTMSLAQEVKFLSTRF